MKLSLPAWAWLCLLCLPLTTVAQPLNNPYYQLYGFVKGHWTDSLNWHKIYNINDFQGATMVDRFNAAQDAAHAGGGGVVYFPAGTYVFENSIQLKSGVVLRGDTPPVNDAKDSLFSPPSRLEFPQYVPTFSGTGTPNSTAFKTISGVAGCSNAGLVNLDINRAGISFRPCCYMPVQTPKGSTNWSLDTNHNIIVLGIRSNNVAVPDGGVPTADQLPWQRFSSRFAANIGIAVKRNSVVANCRINDFWRNGTLPRSNDSYFQPGYLWTRRINGKDTIVPVDSAVQAPFNYTNHHGISVGRKSAVTFAEPWDEPDLFTPGNEIRDNWVYKTMRVGIYAGGYGLVIKGNVIRDSVGKRVWINPQGTAWQRNNSATYENRGIDWSGWNVRVEDNAVQVTRHIITNSGYPSVDGEGILLQECCGGTSVNGIVIRKNDLTGGGYIGIYKSRDVNQAVIDSNNLGGQPIWVWANTNGGIYALNDMRVTENYNTGNITCDGSQGGTASFVTNNRGRGAISVPCHVQVFGNQTYTEPACTAVPTAPYPQVDLVSPATDIFIDQPTTTMLLDAQLLAGTADSIWYYLGTRKLHGTTPQNAAWNWDLPQQNGVYNLAVRARDSQGRETWSAYRSVTYCVGCTVSVKQVGPAEVATAYPNPVSQVLNVDLPMAQTQPLVIRVMDLRGREVHRTLVTPGGLRQADVSSLTPGMYVLQLSHGAHSWQQKLVKE